MHALIAPRRVHVASAQEDIWAGPHLQFLCCAAASEVYELYGKKGFVYEEEDYLNCGKMLHDGKVYTTILNETGASSATVSRVNRVLNYGTGALAEIMDRVSNGKSEAAQEEA